MSRSGVVEEGTVTAGGNANSVNTGPEVVDVATAAPSHNGAGTFSTQRTNSYARPHKARHSDS